MSRYHKIFKGRRWERTRRDALDRAGWRCSRCSKAGALQVHHVKPLAKGGAAFDLGNTEVLCKRCHFGMHRRPVDPARRAWSNLIEEMMQVS